MASKKTHRTKVRVRSRQVLRAEDHSVRWPSEPSRELVQQEHPPIGGTDDDDNNNEPSQGLPLGLANRMNTLDDQLELHPIYDIECSQDQDGVLDCDDDSGDYLDMSEWEED